MSTSRRHDRDDEWETDEGAAGIEPDGQPVLSRRAALAGGTTGFALTASGLLLPFRLTGGAGAAGHPVQRVRDRQDKRREKRRDRLAHRREVNRRQRENDGDDKPRGGIASNIFVGVRYARDRFFCTDLMHLAFQTYDDPGFTKPKKWDTQQSVTLTTQETTSYKFDVTKVRVVVDLRDNLSRWVEIENPVIGYPTVTVYNQDRSRVEEYNYSVGEEHGFTEGRPDFYKILSVRRNEDTPGYKNFVIDVYAPGHPGPDCP